MDITETKYVGTATIQDLPPEVIGMILKYVKLYEDRRSSRSVCKLWHDWINLDSSAEKYVIQQKEVTLLEFKHLVPEFLSYKREKITLDFEKVDFKETNDYWFEKGEQVISLSFLGCRTIPIEEILKYCSRIQEISFDFAVIDGNLLESMEQSLKKGITNSSVKVLNIDSYDSGNFIYVEEMSNFVQLFNGIFPCLKELKLTTELSFGLEEFDEIAESFVNFNFNFKILLTYFANSGEDSEVLFNSSPDMPVRLIHVNITSDILENEDQLLDSIFKYDYKGLRTLRVKFHGEISFLKFQDLISNSSLETLEIEAERIQYVGVDFFKNQLKKLILHDRMISVHNGINFLDSFQNLKVLEVNSISITSFVKILKGLTALEEFEVKCVLPNLSEMFNKETLTNECLKVLRMPSSFFMQIASKNVYILPNLTRLLFINFDHDIAYRRRCQLWNHNRNIHYKDLRRIVCSKLDHLEISLAVPLNQNDHDEYIQWIKNILALFPNIMFFFFEDKEVNGLLTISDEELSELIRKNQKLKYISFFEDIGKRIDGLHSRKEFQLEIQ